MAKKQTQNKKRGTRLTCCGKTVAELIDFHSECVRWDMQIQTLAKPNDVRMSSRSEALSAMCIIRGGVVRAVGTGTPCTVLVLCFPCPKRL
eukprot:2284130-Amphidinium_carterae.2